VNVCIPVVVAVVIARVRLSAVEVANVCEVTLLPLRLPIVPPTPPASVPQPKEPLDQMILSPDPLQVARPAPKRLVSVVVPVTAKVPVFVALVLYRFVAVTAVADALVSVVFPVTSKIPDTERLVVEASPSVVCPVTSKVEEKIPVVPTSAP
jgi:hypothetical protein